uniref:Uncharacterized protein n=1 Tax=Anguilla anguilla TaxID=7936 RepID=A0A0E9W4S6_ANGAN
MHCLTAEQTQYAVSAVILFKCTREGVSQRRLWIPVLYGGQPKGFSHTCTNL